ncbi:MAG: TonB-dependent receptor [Sulfuricella denitrificans]|nr:TonB-dependent receptor [Sulfuricella denitrificans]
MITKTTLCLALTLGIVHAAASDEITSAYLLDDLGDQTTIATRTRLRVDYAPGTINILQSDDLMTQGARTVWEALALVPGFEQSIDETGTRQIVVRGVGKSYSSGAIKILVNDIALNSELMSLANPVLNMPVEQIERIEVIRGPGSAIYGESAYMGVINVITRKQGQRLFAAAGNAGVMAGGGVMSFNNAETGLSYNLNLAGWKANGGGKAGQDQLYADGFGELSHAPGSVNDKLDYRSALFGLNYRKLTLSALWLEDGAGDHYGINNVLPPDEKRIVTRHRHRAFEIKQGLELAPALQAEFKLGWQDFTHIRDHLYLAPGASYDPAIDGPVWLSRDYKENRLTAGADLAWEHGRHTLLLGWSFNQSRIDSASWDWNYPYYDIGSSFIRTSMERTINSFTAQDEFRVNPYFTLTAGLRHDHYDDIGNSTTPRLAAVWQMASRHVIKAQYAEAFRAPTFYELHNGGQPASIRPETVATSELGYIYKGDGSRAGITLFHSSLKNLIVFEDTPDYIGYSNSRSARSQGMELEGEHWLTRNMKFSGNLTWLDTRDATTNQPISGAGHWLANAGLEYRFNQDLAFSIRLREVGERSRETGDLRPALAGYNVTDISARLFNFASTRGLTLRAGIRNVFDQDVRYPAMSIHNGLYPDDYPRGSRQWWSMLTYSF